MEALTLAGLTLALVIVRPLRLSEGIAALLGGVAAVLLGLVPLSQAVRLEVGSWNIFLFFLGMMAVAALADQTGIFDLVAYRTAHLAGGNVRTLYIAIVLLGAVVALLFANDSAALILTPIVYALVVRLALDPLPFVFAITFIADTASIGLPVSNPLNVIVGDAFHLTLGSYLTRLWLPTLLVIAVNLAFFLLRFRRSLHGHFKWTAEGPSSPPGRRSGLILLGLLALAYLLASARGFPLGLVAAAGAAALAINLAVHHGLEFRTAAGEISWSIFGFIGGMLLVVQALGNSGLTAHLGATLIQAAGHSPLQAIAVTTAGTALGANAINNLPMALVMVETIHPLHTSLRPDLIYATILGADLGPNLTHLGSLATFLWLFFLRRQGLDVSAWDYFRLGIMVTPLLLAAAILGLWLTG